MSNLIFLFLLTAIDSDLLANKYGLVKDEHNERFLLTNRIMSSFRSLSNNKISSVSRESFSSMKSNLTHL